MDGYAIAYGAALAVTLCFAARWGGCARVKGAGLLIAAWLGTLAAQGGNHGLTPVWAFAFIDIVSFSLFWWIATHFNRSWPRTVAALHICMFMAHVIYTARGERQDFVYLSVLAVLGYLSMGVIVGPLFIRKAARGLAALLKWRGRKVPAFIQRVAEGGHESVDLKHYMRGVDLPASAFRAPGTRPKKDAR